MSVIGIVAISVLAALFLFVQLGGTTLQLWLGWQLRRGRTADQKEREIVYAETKNLLAGFQAETKATLESAKSGFASIRTEVRGLLEEHRKELALTLEENRRQMQLGIDKINAEALQGAAARSIQAALRLEKIATLLQQMVLDTETRATHEYGPDEFAPEESIFGAPPSGYSVSQTAALDDQALIEESYAESGAN